MCPKMVEGYSTWAPGSELPALVGCGLKPCMPPGQAFLPGYENWTHSGKGWGALPWLRREEGPLLFVYSISRQNNCGSSGRIMFVFTGVFKERSTNKAKQREGWIDFWTYRKGAVKWKPAWKPFSKNCGDLNCQLRKQRRGKTSRPTPHRVRYLSYSSIIPGSQPFLLFSLREASMSEPRLAPHDGVTTGQLITHFALWPGQEKGWVPSSFPPCRQPALPLFRVLRLQVGTLGLLAPSWCLSCPGLWISLQASSCQKFPPRVWKIFMANLL